MFADTYVCVDLSESHGRSWDLGTSPICIHATWQLCIDIRPKAVGLQSGLGSGLVDKLLRDTLLCFQRHPEAYAVSPNGLLCCTCNAAASKHMANCARNDRRNPATAP